VDVLERIIQDSLEFDKAWEARAEPLYAQFRLRHPWIPNFFRRRVRNDADVEELKNDTFVIYLEHLRRTFCETNGVDVQSEPLFEDGNLIGESVLPAKPITDLEKYTFWNPGGWLGTVARNVWKKYVRKAATTKRIIPFSVNQKAEKIELEGPFAKRHNGKSLYLRPPRLDLFAPPRNVEERLIARSEAREIRRRYITALIKLPPVQRAAWVLCQDELLTHEEAEPMLVPALHWRTARAALRRKPLQDSEVSLLLDRADISPDASKAANKLAEHLSDLDRFRAWRQPVANWSRAYLGSLTNHRGSFTSFCVRLEQHGPPEDIRWTISERDRDFIRAIKNPQHQDQIIRSLKQEPRAAYSMKLRPGWVKAPEPGTPEYIRLLEKIRALRKARKRWTTIATTLNASHVPPVFGNTWHHTGARLFARRAGLIKTDPVIPSAPLGDSAETLTTPTTGSTASTRAAHAIHPVDGAPFKSRGHSQIVKNVSRKRKQRSKPVQKSRHNAGFKTSTEDNVRPSNKRPKKTLKKARTRRKTSKTVSTKGASLSKILRRGKSTKKARFKRSVGKRGKKQVRRAARVLRSARL
jgi:DNA-directed RNA polymerase specialized sigma24 family protein